MAAPTYSHPSHPQTFHGSAIAAAPNIPAGTFLPGTLITIAIYLKAGGFAHVYLVRLSRPVDGLDVAVLKRVAVPDKEALASMRTEVETMKRLKGHRHIVTYIDSHASHLKGGGYEVFLLMEYCAGGGLIDFMNTRLQNRLTEPEVLKIFDDVAEGVACMHYLQPPLLHRDLKVENVLIASHRGYKLCDFGSCAPVRAAPQSVTECRLMEEDIQKHTTLQYRSPEMVDVYRKLPIDEKSDIWALGVLLYKLCYYTTPFEDQGQLAILNASFKFPSYPPFSDRIKKLVGSMLRESPQLRPNIYQVVREVCLMRGKEIPIKDIYSDRAAQKVKSVEKPVLPVQPPPSIVAYQAPLPPQSQAIPDITPMRRGRPTKSPAVHSAATSRTRVADPSPQMRPISTDPFAALDSGPPKASQDELSNRFPSVEQFSLLHDYGSKFEFSELSPSAPEAPKKDLNTRLTERLADDAFAPTTQPSPLKLASAKLPESVSRGVTGSGMSGWPTLSEPQPTRPPMISTGTMTSPASSRSPSPVGPTSSRPLEQGSQALPAASRLKPRRPSVLDIGRSLAHTHTVAMSRTPSSSRPSLEIHRPASALDVTSPNAMNRSVSANSKPRPTSVYIDSNLEFLRDLDSATTQASMGPPTSTFVQRSITGQSINSQRSEHIESNVDYLRVMETESDAKPEKRSSSGGFVGKHVKRASMPSISLPNTKSLLVGKFGDAFRRFERNTTGGAGGGDRHDRDHTPSPDMDRALMPTISGSQATSEIGDDWEVSSQDVPPEMKRELEKRRLSQEERRVADAAAEYKRQVADRVPGEGSSGRPSSSRSRANSIQNKVKALLSENHRAPAPKTAEGYGRFTDVQQHQQAYPVDRTGGRVGVSEKPKVDGHIRTKQYYRDGGSNAYRPGASDTSRAKEPTIEIRPVSSSSGGSRVLRKPIALLPNTATSILSTSPTSASRPDPPPKPTKLRGSSPVLPPQISQQQQQRNSEGGMNGNDGADEDWQRNFAKRYPSLSGLELVETVVGPGRKV
ncbi:hypothetical protein HOY82DRAFT_581273 [Tuber indicum]|nr:hypothetical protein HOY82DRAFT_581273 [Tuber indicum]